MKVGAVSDVSLDKGKALVTFTVDSGIALGSDTTAHIRTGTLLGQRILTLESAGSCDDASRATSSRSRARRRRTRSPKRSATSPPTPQAPTPRASTRPSTRCRTTIDQIAPQLGPTFDGVTRLSRSLNSRNDTLRSLLKSAGTVSGVLAQRSQQLNTLILSANDLIGVLNDRREAIVDLLASISALSKELSGLVADNEKTVGARRCRSSTR